MTSTSAQQITLLELGPHATRQKQATSQSKKRVYDAISNREGSKTEPEPSLSDELASQINDQTRSTLRYCSREVKPPRQHHLLHPRQPEVVVVKDGNPLTLGGLPIQNFQTFKLPKPFCFGSQGVVGDILSPPFSGMFGRSQWIAPVMIPQYCCTSESVSLPPRAEPAAASKC